MILRVLYAHQGRYACNAYAKKPPGEGERRSNVVDLTTYMATPATGRVLGEWGADVIKVEAAKGDPLRVTQAAVFNMPMSDEENLAFDMCNLNKRFISLNLKSETGAEVMDKLLADADVFLTNTRTKSLGLRQEGPRKGRSWL